MFAWRNLSIQVKLVTAFAAVFVVITALGLFGLSQTAAVNDDAANIRDGALPSLRHMGTLVADAKQARVIEALAVISVGAGDFVAVKRDITGFQRDVASVGTEYDNYHDHKMDKGTKDAILTGQFDDAWTNHNITSATVVDDAGKGRREGRDAAVPDDRSSQFRQCHESRHGRCRLERSAGADPGPTWCPDLPNLAVSETGATSGQVVGSAAALNAQVSSLRTDVAAFRAQLRNG